MANVKYGQHIKSLSFPDSGPGSFTQGIKMGHDFHGQNIHIQYGTYSSAGNMGQEPYISQVHDFNQVLLWIGADASNLLELGAECELCLGPEKNKYKITTPTAVSIPKGLPHLPATITNMDKRFIFMVISCSPEWKATQADTGETPSVLAPWNSKYRERILRLSFRRKGAWSYGPLNPDDSGGVITTLNPKDVGFDFHFNYENIKKAPYRFGPNPDRPHLHSYDEILLFMGTDCNNLSDLGAEAEISLGKEREKHIVNTSTIVALPSGFPHLPLVITKLSKPFIFWDISLRPENTPPTTTL